MLPILLIGCLCLPLVVLPGFLLLRLHPAPGEPAVERGFLGIAVGFYLVAWTSVTGVGLVGMFAPLFVRWWIIAGVAALWSGGLAWRLRRRRVAPPAGQLRFGRWDGVVALALLAVFALALLHYDRLAFDEERCIIRSAMLPYHNYMHRGMEMARGLPDFVFDRDAFLLWNAGQREGMIFVLAPWLALFQFLGFRVCFAFSHLVVAGASYILTRRLLGSRWLALAVLLGASLNPSMLRMTAVDDNLLAVAVGALALAWLLRRPAAWFWLMLPYGLFLGIRHEALLTLPALLAFAWRLPEGLRGRRVMLREVALGLPLFLLPNLIYHGAMFASMGTLYESFVPWGQRFPHSFLGLHFSLRGLLGWPFAPLARSAYGAFPNLVQFPLALAGGLGLLGWALLPAGARWLWRHHRPFLWLGIGWFVPFMALLLVQGNWTEADKMGIPNTVLTPVLVMMAAGALWIWGAPAGRARRMAGVGGVLLMLTLAVLGLGRVRAPADPRGFGMRPFYIPEEFPIASLPEQPDLVTAEQGWLATPQLLPFQGHLTPAALAHDAHALRLRAAALWQDLGHPGFAVAHPTLPGTVRALSGLDRGMFFPVSGLATRSIPSPPSRSGAPMVVELDLASPLPAAGLLLRPAGEGAPPLSFGPGAPLRIDDLALPWAAALGTLLAYDDGLGEPTFVLIFHRDPWAGQVAPPAVTRVVAADLPAGPLRVAVPGASWARFWQLTSFFPYKLHSWVQPLGPDGPGEARLVLP